MRICSSTDEQIRVRRSHVRFARPFVVQRGLCPCELTTPSHKMINTSHNIDYRFVQLSTCANTRRRAGAVTLPGKSWHVAPASPHGACQ